MEKIVKRFNEYVNEAKKNIDMSNLKLDIKSLMSAITPPYNGSLVGCVTKGKNIILFSDDQESNLSQFNHNNENKYFFEIFPFDDEFVSTYFEDPDTGEIVKGKQLKDTVKEYANDKEFQESIWNAIEKKWDIIGDFLNEE